MKNVFLPKCLLATAVLLVALGGAAHAQSYSNDSGQYDDAGKWAGPYAGVHFGTTWADMRNGGNIGPSGTTNTLMGGGQAGYNWQSYRWVYGAEGDFSKLDAGSKTPTAEYDEDWMMTFRGRAGYAFGRFLPYGTFGVALTDTFSKIPGVGSDSNLQPGIAAGGGVDFAASDRWVWRAEYLYTDVSKDSSDIGGTTVTGGSGNSTVRLGLNYMF